MISKQVRELANDLSGAGGLVLPSDAAVLLRFAKRYAKIQERWCNDDMSGTPGAEDRLRAKEAQLEEIIRGIVKNMPSLTGVKFSGDPRGYCVKVIRKDGRYNTWGGADDGWGIA